jgi:hypothetical protein
VELAAAGLQEGGARLLRDLLQRLQAVGGEAGAGDVDALHAGARQRHERRLGVGLQPLGLAEAALEGDRHLLGPQRQPLAQQARGLLALTVVGSPSRSVRSGTPWKLSTSLSGRPWVASGPPAAAPARGCSRVVVVLVDEAQLGHAARAARPGVDGVEGAAVVAAAVLRVERQHQHAGGTGVAQGVELAGHRWVAVAHRVAHRDRMAALAEVSRPA